MRKLKEIIKLLGLSNNDNLNDIELLKQYIFKNDNIDYNTLNKYPELLSLFKSDIDLNDVDWFSISRYQKLSESFIKEFSDKVNWPCISMYQQLSESFIIEFSDKVNWFNISIYQKLSEDFIREFKDKVYWSLISMYQKLSESFIKEFQNKVDWTYISEYQKLSEDFIKEFKNEVIWSYISMHQKLSESFIREFKNEVSWYRISIYQKLSESFIKEFSDRICLNEKSWLYKDDDYKLECVKKSGLYEIEGDYVIGFKGIRSDRYSNYNFQYQYLKDTVHECHADFNTNNENSFGLSVWTYDEAKEYCNQLVIKVKIHKNDLSALIHDNHKIRCQKFTTIN